MALLQMTYSSSVVIPPGRHEAELASILAASVRKNKFNGVTGCLAYREEWFFQVLEGEEDAVLQTLSRIKKDPRHADINTRTVRPIRNRSFPEWSMAAVDLGESQAAYLATFGLGGAFTPQNTTPSQMLMLMMTLADKQRMVRLSS
jgi:Sensors of blue-light using FAD